MPNAYAIIHMTGYTFEKRNMLDFILLFSGIDVLKIILIPNICFLVNENLLIDSELAALIIVFFIGTLCEITAIAAILLFNKINLFRSFKFIVLALLVTILGDGLWFLISALLLIMFNMGTIAG